MEPKMSPQPSHSDLDHARAVSDPQTPISNWMLGLLLMLVTGLGGALGQSMRSDIQTLTARVTAAETEARGRGVQVDDLRNDIREVKGDIKAGFLATTGSIRDLESKITAAQPQRTGR